MVNSRSAAAQASDGPPKHIVIVGGGVIGTMTSHYLAKDMRTMPLGSTITVVEECSVAAGASGKAGGFISATGHAAATSKLAALSFELHHDLATELDGAQKWQYRRLSSNTYSLSTRNVKPPPAKKSRALPWMNESLIVSSSIFGDVTEQAQIMPKMFTQSVMRNAVDSLGVKLVIATAKALHRDAMGRPISLIVEDANCTETELSCTDLVLCAGPWTSRLATKLLGTRLARRVGVHGSRAHSIVLQSIQPLTPHAIFCDLARKDGHFDIEIYCRPDDTAYVCGDCPSHINELDLPETADDVEVHEDAIDFLKENAGIVSSSHLKDAPVAVEQACLLPISDIGTPIIGRLDPGIYVGAGHTVWGMTLGPATGKVISEIVQGKPTSVPIKHLAPK
ncbi:uncharacterized protein L969DRAFT_87293 [Mixia osmundae IAM 14324]|uniref:FAD dependent oxidoreductase domain-containing protein n=1 Tax=Mixia osmundae (strain CBS 9802 / IAM 14324 / JCM 22182 / KY 12970) TaxID=764103 RepID=G7E3E9_MIXOS|nr:uncharacterized protein L969DRAFT_87293 [Mixia osmundae IAM 14324]KEI39345.1 hypothetical protein L969DRAFT_87293 [Mixia osmundae IAM 14324]GAA97359.1 hypothetical protein E5Q_04037 [Mixia osmundae IAM 14324]